MKKKIADMPFKTRRRMTVATTPLAFHRYFYLGSSTAIDSIIYQRGVFSIPPLTYHPPHDHHLKLTSN
jgi:hypothetical protein